LFLYPTLTIGFVFLAVPLLVHLINMLRHRRQRWAAMDFLLASYRKQKKWIRLRQLLLMLSRLALAVVLMALLAGWTGGRRMLGMLGGQTTHHVFLVDDSYSMGDESLASAGRPMVDLASAEVGGSANITSYRRALRSLQDLTQRLAADDQEHQLTALRASRAALATRGGSESGDAAADLSAQTITSDSSLVNRLMGSRESSLDTDLLPALNLAANLINSTPADAKVLYIASDFRQREWGAAERMAESLKQLSGDVSVRFIDCAVSPAANLAITEIAPQQDVWVAGVPVVVQVTVRNYGVATASNVSIATRVIRYADDLQLADPTLANSGESESLPPLVIESLEPGAEITKSFQVYVTQTGTHVIEAALPDDALPLDNRRCCTLPLTDVEKVLVIDGDPDGRGAFHVASVLNPGSQVRIGAIPEVQPPAFLRTVALETLATYRAVYLIDVPEIGETAAAALDSYVNRGGGLAWFLGGQVNADQYNQTLLAEDRFLLPGRLAGNLALSPVEDATGEATADVQWGEKSPLLAPLRSGGDNPFALVGVARSWQLEPITAPAAPAPRTLLSRRDGSPLVTRHEVGRGRVITVLMGLDGTWTNWPSDPTFVVFLLQANADLWSGVAPITRRYVDSPIVHWLAANRYTGAATYFPAADQPPRVPIEVAAQPVDSETTQNPVLKLELNPSEMVIADDPFVDEVLQPGIAEWELARSDGRGEVLPVAAVLNGGDGDLARADHAAIAQQLMPIEVSFVDSAAWSEENNIAGSSTLTLVLLGLLAAILAIEQLLAYWASYHVSPRPRLAGSGERSARAPLGGHR
jgi:hypothetical protein